MNAFFRINDAKFALNIQKKSRLKNIRVLFVAYNEKLWIFFGEKFIGRVPADEIVLSRTKAILKLELRAAQSGRICATTSWLFPSGENMLARFQIEAGKCPVTKDSYKLSIHKYIQFNS